jgi:3-oxoacyl-(acyl-carrier-protein) synthase
VETVAAVVALERGFIPATLGTTDIDPELAACDVVLEVRVSRATQVLILAESFGGRCAALLLEAA